MKPEIFIRSCPNVGVSSLPFVHHAAKKSSKRVKWADHFGGDLTASRVLDTVETPAATTEAATGEDASVSWTDRKKRDRLREKELLAKAK